MRAPATTGDELAIRWFLATLDFPDPKPEPTPENPNANAMATKATAPPPHGINQIECPTAIPTSRRQWFLGGNHRTVGDISRVAISGTGMEPNCGWQKNQGEEGCVCLQGPSPDPSYFLWHKRVNPDPLWNGNPDRFGQMTPFSTFKTYRHLRRTATVSRLRAHPDRFATGGIGSTAPSLGHPRGSLIDPLPFSVPNLTITV